MRAKTLLQHISFGLYLLLFLAHNVSANQPLSFDNEQQELRYKVLVKELRCLVCQNQNLADSDADLAQDLRKEVLELMKSGKSDAEIKTFLVDRYGEFVLYRPRLEKATYLLWLGPAGLLLIGAIAVGMNIRKRHRQFLSSKHEQDSGHVAGEE